ncbi:hypothetical protein [Croceicoccus mobilis]|uniref:Uncharacterized protein n=1 Tax=Croceicoccus mobilis TaxID=1703339 RepID=A0A916YTE0_9SPHN|nr:hypothetical protein [Croceicoccus mobilis]GGD60388.1 hypothetical protein GCM10010990_07280 [Croceicoccus mobilis]
MGHLDMASLAIAEMREFAEFDPAEQRYIRRSLDVGLARADAYDRWGRDVRETDSIRRQHLAYQDLGALRGAAPTSKNDPRIDNYVGRLIRLSVFDLGEGCLFGFSAYRFLYERLLGPDARPWLPAAFCAASALPQIAPEKRKTLLHSISEAAACAPGWSRRQPSFFPDWLSPEEEAEIRQDLDGDGMGYPGA